MSNVIRGIAVAAALLAAGCATLNYKKVKTGEFSGKVQVTWIAPDYFIYDPAPGDPLIFKRADGKTIEPQRMYTDGGSIPPFLWGIPGYSPWSYAPAYMIHDWLFEAHHCGIANLDWVTFDDSATILAEAIKTLMEGGEVPRDPEVVDVIYSGVSSFVAQDLWSNGQCHPPTGPLLAGMAPGAAGPGAPAAPPLPGQGVVVFTMDLTHHR